MNKTEETVGLGKKKAIARLIVVFLILMLGLTFFSNTINNFSLPKVSYESISGGSLIRQLSGTGNVEAVKTREFYIDTSLTVLNCSVKVGDAVKKNQVLLNLDTSNIADQLADGKAILEQKKLSLEKLKSISEHQGNTSYDNTVANSEASLEAAEKNYDAAKALFDEGAETKQNLDTASANLEKAKREHLQAEADRDAAIRNNSSDTRSMLLDIEIQQRKVASLTSQLELSVIKAPADGVITELNFDEGEVANASKPLYKLAETSEGFVFTATADVSNVDFVKTGDAASVTIDALSGKGFKGKVSDIVDNEQNRGSRKDIHIEIPPEGLIGGESGNFSITKNTGYYKMLISNSAIGQDNSGYFVYVVSEKRGPLGNEYYIQRANVTVGESDSFKTVIESGLTFRDMVVTSSDKYITEGSKVILDQ